MAKFKCWDPESCEVEDAREYVAYDAESAAHRYADEVCDEDCELFPAYEDGVNVHVREVGDDGTTVVHVWMEMVPQFRTQVRD